MIKDGFVTNKRWIRRNLLNSNQIKIKQDIYFKQLLNNKPIQYILGAQPFCDLNLLTKQNILIPRWETEEMTRNLADKLNSLKIKKLKILDICTGSGCISLGLSNLLKNDVIIHGTDINPNAIKLAKLNQRLLKIPTTRVEFFIDDIFDTKITEKYDLIISNPPYITTKEYQTLDLNVKDYEDVTALLANDTTGIKYYKEIIKNCNKLLYKNDYFLAPNLVFEFGGNNQSKFMKNLFNQNRIVHSIVKDTNNQDRVLYGFYNNWNLNDC